MTGSDEQSQALREEAEHLAADNADQREPSALKKAWTAARKAGWGAESDELVKLLTFVAVLAVESVPRRLRRRRPIAIEAVRARQVGPESHIHITRVRTTEGIDRPAAEVIWRIDIYRDEYVTCCDDEDPVKVIVVRCRGCDENRLSTEVGDNRLLALPRF